MLNDMVKHGGKARRADEMTKHKVWSNDKNAVDVRMDREDYKRQNNINNNVFTQWGGTGRECSSKNKILVATAS